MYQRKTNQPLPISWSKTDIQQLTDLYQSGDHNREEIAKILNRSVSSTNSKIRKLKLSITKRKDYYKDYTNYENDVFQVIRYVGKWRKSTKWECLCKLCYNKINLCPSSILQNKSCGCKWRNGKWCYKGCGDLSSTKFSAFKCNARHRKLEFSITIEYAWQLFIQQNKLCRLSGQPITLYCDTVRIRDCTASLDRIDSSKGYIEGNVQWIHKDVNIMKLDHSQNDFIQICNKVSSHSMSKNITIGLWGGTGFIGSVLVPMLLEAGYKVIVFDNFFKSVDSLLAHFNNPNFRLVELDITREKDVIKSFEYEFEYLILLSGVVGVPACNKHHTLATVTNDIGWGYVAQHKPKEVKLLAASTGSVYGAVENGLCNEDTPTNPLSHYGITKLAGEKHVMNAGGVAYRFATAAGVSPAIRLNLLPNYLVHQAIHERFLNVFEPHYMRTFIDIRDFCNSFLFGIEHFNDFKYQVYNVGDERNNWSKIQLVKYVQEKTGCSVACNETSADGDARNYASDYSRINSEGFKCKYLIQDTVDELVKVMPHIKLDQKYW